MTVAGVVLGFLIALQTTTTSQTGPAVRTFAHGTDSHISVHREVVARTAGWWQFIWHEHTGSFTPPAIDFSRTIVVGVFAGQAAAGTSIEITSVTQDGRATTVYYREHRPATGSTDKARSTSPFHLVIVPANRSTVTFVKLTGS